VHSVILNYQLLFRRWLPIIPVTLNWRGVSVRSEGYLDSGAFYSIFKMSVVAELGLDMSHAKDRMFVVADGSFIPAKLIKLPIEIGGRRRIAEVAFSDRLNIGFNLLGRKDVFEGFDEVIFREVRREVELRWTEK
jgi:predicted aspartyl protease